MNYQYNPLIVNNRIKDTRLNGSGLWFIVWSGNEGKYKPHFHICNEEKPKSKKYFECCIRLDVCDYFNHKPNHKLLTSKQKKTVVSFLKSIFKNNKTVWQYLVQLWSMQYPSTKTNNMPDYSKLKTIGE